MGGLQLVASKNSLGRPIALRCILRYELPAKSRTAIDRISSGGVSLIGRFDALQAGKLTHATKTIFVYRRKCVLLHTRQTAQKRVTHFRIPACLDLHRTHLSPVPTNTNGSCQSRLASALDRRLHHPAALPGRLAVSSNKVTIVSALLEAYPGRVTRCTLAVKKLDVRK